MVIFGPILGNLLGDFLVNFWEPEKYQNLIASSNLKLSCFSWRRKSHLSLLWQMVTMRARWKRSCSTPTMELLSRKTKQEKNDLLKRVIDWVVWKIWDEIWNYFHAFRLRGEKDRARPWQMVPQNPVHMDKWSPTNLIPLEKWPLEYSVFPGRQAVRIRNYSD